ncbi:SAM-dependent methyltransferase [Fodinicola feengrottensis]|uniref:SAM-dependent methyltransferase n=1 Tax=Fodinicola feengrottensis TaxID=435914 RepID=UPI0024435EA8|nr:SAM-dependent methyltransferase [Fodinicola feengrottensis]
MCGFVPLRTRYFDDQLRDAVRADLRQIVILAAGLDGRAYRLDLPPDVSVFELDTPDLMAFKAPVVEAAGVRPNGPHSVIGVDLREDFGPALLSAGFEPAERTLWLVEGLLPYLRLADIDLLMARVGGLSRAGSRMVTDER